MKYPLSSADLCIFSPESSNSCYIKKCRYWLHFKTQFLIILTFFEYLKVVSINTVAIKNILNLFFCIFRKKSHTKYHNCVRYLRWIINLNTCKFFGCIFSDTTSAEIKIQNLKCNPPSVPLDVNLIHKNVTGIKVLHLLMISFLNSDILLLLWFLINVLSLVV